MNLEALNFGGKKVLQQQQQQQEQYVDDVDSDYDSEEDDLDDIPLVEPLQGGTGMQGMLPEKLFSKQAEEAAQLQRFNTIQLQLNTNETVLTPRDVPLSDNWRPSRLQGRNDPNLSARARLPTPKTYDDQSAEFFRAKTARVFQNPPPKLRLAHQNNNGTIADNFAQNPTTPTPLSPSTWAGDLGNSPKQDGRGQLSRNILVDLTSNAFVLDRRSAERGMGNGRGISVPEMILGRCVKAFGIEQEDLCFYELREVAVENIPEDCSHVGVAVRRSGFSLSALEEILMDNRKLQAVAEKNSTVCENLQAELRQKSQDCVRVQLQSAEHEAELKRLKVVVSKMEQENQMIRGQLQRSENLRMQAQRALEDLKKEFECFAQDVTLHPSRSLDTQKILSGFNQASQGLMRSFKRPQDMMLQTVSSLDEGTSTQSPLAPTGIPGKRSSSIHGGGGSQLIRSASPSIASSSQLHHHQQQQHHPQQHLQQQQQIDEQQPLQQQQQQQQQPGHQQLQQILQQQQQRGPVIEERAAQLLGRLLDRLCDEQVQQRLEQLLGSPGSARQ
eukprot:TRINITY_DN3236_c0_g2_i2.p1 TRINITY_DN3236_c0_g2~~TRINITY_DN3236_c0_g2_i2.p1  ORF type:complete len:557 (+),score=112.15 TRINITY_DN3236_c0_g2_i2:1004-2674(+)